MSAVCFCLFPVSHTEEMSTYFWPCVAHCPPVLCIDLWFYIMHAHVPQDFTDDAFGD